MTSYDLNQQFIAEIELVRTSQAFPHIRYGDAPNLGRNLFSRAGWFPATSGNEPKHIYVLFVGTAESIEKHGPAIEDVRARGNDLLVFEFAGQGASGRFLADPHKVHAMRNGFDMWVESLAEFLGSDLFDAIKQRSRVRGCELIALPYSLGGHMFARLMQQRPDLAQHFTRIVYVNPVVAMNSAGNMAHRFGQQMLARFFSRRAGKADSYVPGHGRYHPGDRPLEKSSIGSDRERHEWLCDFYHRNDHLTMWGMTYGWFHEANQSLTRMWDRIIDNEIKRPFRRVWRAIRSAVGPQSDDQRVPTLVISSERDSIVIAHYVQRFAGAIDADLLHLPFAKHEPSQEPPPIRDGTFAAVAAWVQNPERPQIWNSTDIRFIANKA